MNQCDRSFIATRVLCKQRAKGDDRKDKGGEKLAESEVIGLPLSQYAEKEHLLEHRTDGTDAFDTLYIGCETVCANESRAELVPAMPSAAKLGALVHKFPYHDSFSLSMSGVL